MGPVMRLAEEPRAVKIAQGGLSKDCLHVSDVRSRVPPKAKGT